MIKPALAIIEEVYAIALNPTKSYFAQLDNELSASGELSNKKQTNEVLFRLSELVDAQAQRIAALEEQLKPVSPPPSIDATKPLA